MASSNQIPPIKWISIIIRDPTAALVAQPSHDARSTNKCSNASLQESVYARWASCDRVTFVGKKQTPTVKVGF